MRRRRRRRVGQSNAGDAAGNAAKDRAAQSAWPPSKGDYEAIGAAAGSAAGAAIGGPIGAAAGLAIGGVVGGLVFEIGNELVGGSIAPGFNAGHNPAGQWQNTFFNQTLPAYKRVLEDLATSCGTSVEEEEKALLRWGAPAEWPYAQWKAYLQAGNIAAANAGLQATSKQFFGAASARAAECETNKRGSGGTSSAKKALAVAIVGGLAVALLQKVIFRN